ncbi:MAG: PTS sugar transporter subunit IIC [Clostridium sp.]
MDKFMEKFEAVMGRLMAPIATKLSNQRHICAVKDAFILTFPVTMAGSLMLLLNYVILSPNGFIAKILRLHTLIPNLADYQAIFTPVIKGSTEILAILIVFLVARNLAKNMGGDDLLTGITAISVFFIIYPEAMVVEKQGYLTAQYFGAQGLFVALIVGILTAEILTRLSRNKRFEISMPEQVPPAVARTFKILIPVIITTLFFAVGNFLLLKISEGGLHTLVYDMLQKPLTALGGNAFSVILIAILANFLWVMGIHGPNTLAAIISTITAEPRAENLAYVTEHGTAWGAPYPITYDTYYIFGTLGGSGSTLGLIIAIFLFSKQREQKEIAKLSVGPGVFNINEPVIFGLPIVLNPLMIIPFVLTPVVTSGIVFTAINLQIMPPPVYQVPWTTPTPIYQFLATGGHVMGLVFGLICLVASVLMYAPFVMVSNKVSGADEIEEEKEIALKEKTI